MPRTAIPATKITLAGITPSGTDGVAGDVANGNYISGVDNDGLHLWVAVKNTGAGSRTCTFTTPGTSSGGYAVADEIKTLAAGEVKWYGPFPLADFSRQLQINVEHAEVKLQAFWI